MLILNSLSEIKPSNFQNTVCTMGVFDGIHIGHRKIIEASVRKAKEINGTSVVITFDKNPFSVLDPSYNIPVLTPIEIKLQLLEALGTDVCILIKFNKTTASISAESWIKDILWNRLHMKSIFIGQDSFFGKNREGTIDLLKIWSKQLGFRVYILEKARINKLIVSSTLIRDLILKGDIKTAEIFLGRPFSITGNVIRGRGGGRTLGFPTANLDTGGQCIPRPGVYAAKSIVEHIMEPSVVNIGQRPTFAGQKHRKAIKPSFEVHFLKTPKETLYDKQIEVFFEKYLREEVEFNTDTELIEQIKKDIEQTCNILL